MLLVSIAAAALGAAGTATAGAAQWRFGGTLLTGTETIMGTAKPSTLTIPGATTTCEEARLTMKISNVAGAGRGEVTGLAQYECTTGSNCTVLTIEAEKLPWLAHIVTFAAKDYVVVEGVKIGIHYGGALCALEGLVVVVKGTAGGAFDNATSKLTFNGPSFTATGTSLKVGSTSVQWTAAFPLEALGPHSGEALEIG
jgi:hypothetical protein